MWILAEEDLLVSDYGSDISIIYNPHKPVNYLDGVLSNTQLGVTDSPRSSASSFSRYLKVPLVLKLLFLPFFTF